MEIRIFELRISRGGEQGAYSLFAASSSCGEGEAVARVDSSAPPLGTLTSLLAEPQTLQGLRTVGTTLFESFFRDEVRRVFRDACAEVLGTDQLILRLVLRIEPPELTVLPWEMLFDAEQEVFLAAAPKISLSRTLSLVKPFRPMTMPPDARAVIIIPKSGLDTEAERSETEKLLRQTLHVDVMLGKITRDRLRSALREKEYHLVHFAGHGAFRDDEAMIYLDSERGILDPVPAQAFADFFLYQPQVRLIVLNACEGGMPSYEALGGLAPELLRRGIPAVIAMQSTITNSSATRFASSFYRTLVRGPRSGSVDIALAQARSALLQAGFFDSHLVAPAFASPVLYLRSRESQLWAPLSPDLPGAWAGVQRQAERVRKNLEPATLRRIARREVQQKYLPVIRKSIEERRRRIVAILGPAGYGKSTALGEVYDALREEGVPWVALVDCGELVLSGGEDLDLALGRAAGGGTEAITQLTAKLTRSKGAGVVVIDTLDLILQPSLVPHLQRVLSDLGDSEVTVVFSCRDHDYDMVLGARDRLKQVADRLERFNASLSPFLPKEIEQAAQAFVDQRLGAEGSAQGKMFAQKILTLSADSRPLRQITEHPLLLAMLCELFAERADVPRDLTVSQLYEGYWQEKVVKSRVFGPGSSELIEKRRLSLQIAEKLLDRSEEHLQESISEMDLDLDGDARAAALEELLSEGVLKSHLVHSLRFFHQTFLEFAMALWLSTQAGAVARARILAALTRQGGKEAPLHWWPVLRQLLVMAQEQEFAQIMGSLALDSSAAFRTASLAAAIRSDRSWLEALLRRALVLGSEHQGYLCFAVESAPALDPDLAWFIILRILEDGQRKGALAAIQAAVALLATAGSSQVVQLRRTLDAIDERTRRDRNLDERTELQGQLFRDFEPFVQKDGESETLDLLEERYLSLTERIRRDVVRLFSAVIVPDERKLRFLETLLGHPADGEVSEEVIALFLLRLQVEGAVARKSSDALAAVLQAAMPQNWEGFYAGAVARLYNRNPVFIDVLLRDFLSSPPRLRHRDLRALDELFRGGASDLVTNVLLTFPPESLSIGSLRELSVVVRGISSHAGEADRQALANWLQPLVQRWPEETVSLYSSVADASERAWALLVSTLDGLMAAGRTKVLKTAVLAVRPAVVHRLAPQIERFAQLNPARNLYKQMLVELYTSSTQRSEALLRLRDLALDKEREISVKAVLSLAEAARRGEHLSIAELLPLLDSSHPMVRESFFDIVLAIQERRAEEVSTGALRTLAEVAGRDAHPAVVQRFCKLLQEEIRRGAELPREVVEIVTGLADHLKRERGLGTKVARALIRVYKLIAQREVRELAPLLERALLRFLEEIDTNLLSNGEIETVNLISALERVDRGVLSRLVEHGSRVKPRNVRPIAIAIQRTEGKSSSLLVRILAAEWCPPEARSVILDYQGV